MSEILKCAKCGKDIFAGSYFDDQVLLRCINCDTETVHPRHKLRSKEDIEETKLSGGS